MIVRRYTGGSLEQLREVIITELGSDAVIINTEKRKKNGVIPGLGKTFFEVTAVLEEARDGSVPAVTPAPAVELEPLMEAQKQQYHGIRRSMKMIDEKLADVDDWMSQLARKVASPNCPPMLAHVHPAWHDELTARAEKLSSGSSPTPGHWHEALMEKLDARPGLDFQRAGSEGPVAYVMVGPTGIGKTTTLAKMAAKCVLAHKLNVGVITLDTYRLAGAEQLREYTELLGVEMGIAFTEAEMEKYLDRFSDKDVIFIDTPGRSQYDHDGINDIRRKLGHEGMLGTLLVVPANVRQQDVEMIVKSYHSLGPKAIILTKTDETSCCDGVTLLQDVTGLPIVYVTDGQRVPEDIHEASPGLVASLVLATENLRIRDLEEGI